MEVVVDLVVDALVVVERTVDGTLVVVEGIVEGSLVVVLVDLTVVEVVIVEGVVEVVVVEIVVEGIVNATVEARVDPSDVVDEEVVVDKRMSRPCLSTPWSYHLQRIRPSSGETGLIPSVFGTIVSPCSLLL